MFKYENGREATQLTTGFKGVITSRSDNLFGCNRYFIQPVAGKDMKIPDGYWVDEADIKVGKLKVKPTSEKQDPPGGQMSKIK